MALIFAISLVAPPRVALAAPAIDQQQPTIDTTVGGLAIGGNSQQKLGQTVTAGADGDLVQVDLPVACSGTGDLIIEIRDVAPGGAPGPTLRSTTTITGTTLPSFPPGGVTFRALTLSTPVPLTAGSSYAIVLNSTGTTPSDGCGIFRGPVGDSYPGGDLYYDALPNAPGWVHNCGQFPSDRCDLPFRTWVGSGLQAELALTLTEGSDPVLATYTSFSYVASVTNNGFATATGVVVTFTLSADLAVASAAGCTVTLPTVACPMTDLANGATDQVGINVKMKNGTSATSVTVAASVSSSVTDPNTTNNAASESTTVLPVVDMEFAALSAAPSPANVGDQIAYTVTVTNAASTYAYPATNVVAIMDVPSGATFVSVTSPVTSMCGFDPPTNKYGCNFGTLAPNASATMTITVTAPSNATTLFSTAQTVANEAELEPWDNSNTLQVQVNGEQISVTGGGASTDTENCTSTGCDGATAFDPIETTVSGASTGTITIREVPTTGTPPSGYSFLGQQVTISAPAASYFSPLDITFEIHASLIPSGQSAGTIQIFRNGTVVPACTDPAVKEAVPDPCVWDRSALPNGNARITVLTSQASDWNVGIREPFAFGGFQRPIGDGMNVVNAGRTVPLKFSLSGFHGMEILAAGTPASHPVACDGTATEPVQDVDQLSDLRYDESTDTYSLGWSTDPAWAGTCRELVLQLIDGSEHSALFRFR